MTSAQHSVKQRLQMTLFSNLENVLQIKKDQLKHTWFNFQSSSGTQLEHNQGKTSNKAHHVNIKQQVSSDLREGKADKEIPELLKKGAEKNFVLSDAKDSKIDK